MKFVMGLLLFAMCLGVSPLWAQAPPPGRSIAVMKVGTGTGSVTTSIGNVTCGIALAPVVCLSTFRLKFGTPVSITAIAAPGSVFAGWVGLPVACPAASCSFIMPNQHVQVRATFKLITPAVPDTTPPSTPILRGYVHSPTIIQLEWPQVTDNEGVHSFILQRCIGVSSTCTPWTVVTSGITGLTFLQTGLVANTSYVYRLQVRDWTGNLSPWSDILTIKTPATGTVSWTLGPVSIATTRKTDEDPNAPNPRFTVSMVNTGTVGLTLSWTSGTAWIVDLIPENGLVTIAPGATGTYSFAVSKTPWGCVGGCPLPPQFYTGSVSIAGGASTKAFSVTMRLETPGTPVLVFTTPVVSATMVPNQVALISLPVQNTGLGTISFLASEAIPWLTTPVGPGILTGPSQVGTSVLTLNTAGMVPGTYTGTVTMTPIAPWASIAPITATVNLTVVPPATIALSTTNVTIQGQVTLPNPQGFSVTVSNVGTGIGVMSWTATKSATWLSVAPVSGTVAIGGPGVNILLAGLLPGTYTGTVSIASPGASNSPQIITVTLVVLPAPVPGKISVSWDGVPVPMLNADGTVLMDHGPPLLNPDGTPVLNPDGTNVWGPGTPVTISGYHIWRSLVPGVYPIGPQNFSPTWNLGPPVGTVLYGTNTFTDTTVFIGTTYYYVVTSFNDFGDSLPSNEVFILVTPATGAP